MDELNLLKTYWEFYLESQESERLPERPYETEQFGDSVEMADELGRLILEGKKTATCSALWEYETEQEAIPTIGQRLIVLDGSHVPLCIREITEVEIRTFDAIDARFACAEGEGDRTLESWRREHWGFFSRNLPEIGRQPSQQMPLVCERFQVLYRLPLLLASFLTTYRSH